MYKQDNILFRGFDPDSKQMFYNITPANISKYASQYPNIIFSQFSGMTDFVRERVFSGDVLEYEHGGYKIRRIVVFKNGGFVTVNSMSSNIRPRSYITHERLFRDKMIVVGNIYENPNAQYPLDYMAVGGNINKDNIYIVNPRDNQHLGDLTKCVVVGNEYTDERVGGKFTIEEIIDKNSKYWTIRIALKKNLYATTTK